MRNVSLVLVILLGASFWAACNKLTDVKPDITKKDSTVSTKKDTAVMVPVDPALLVGYWQVINDTSTTVPWGIWEGRPAAGQNYIGKPSDYYQFTADNHTYTSMSGTVDTGSYAINQNVVHVIFTYFNGQESTGGIYNTDWAVSNLTAHTATLTVTYVTPETAITSVTNLKR